MSLPLFRAHLTLGLTAKVPKVRSVDQGVLPRLKRREGREEWREKGYGCGDKERNLDRKNFMISDGPMLISLHSIFRLSSSNLSTC